MRKVKCALLFWLSALSVGYSQKQGNLWYFADGLGLDFSNEQPILLTNGEIMRPGPLSHAEACSVISDSDGKLLFYTNGEKIWNRNHQVMPNGDGLLGHYSSTQGALIVPLPESKHIFYVFTTDGFYENDLKNGFRYSVVDMCLNDSLGDVVEGQKNILLLDTVAEKLSAVRHANSNDYWVLTHKFYSNRFYAYHLTPEGIGDVIISESGSVHPHPMAFQGTGSAIGQMKFSPDGTKLAIVNANSFPSIAEVCDFNSSTGLVSNCFSIQSNTNFNHYGISFSPDNTKLYLSCILNNNGIYQYNLLLGSSEDIIASRTAISQKTAYGLQLSNNGKIYVARYNYFPYIDVIHEPNNLGLACNLEDSAIYLQGRSISFGLPNFIDSYAYTNGLVSCTEEPDTLTIPTAFTPDGDGINDAFEIAHLPAGSGLVIYGRWGLEVFRSKPYDGSWGANNVTGGVYFYILTLPNGERRKGVVHVVK